jgi:hypothetical protein
LSSKYLGYGSNFLSYLFGNQIAKLVEDSTNQEEILDLISVAMIVIKRLKIEMYFKN